MIFLLFQAAIPTWNRPSYSKTAVSTVSGAISVEMGINRRIAGDLATECITRNFARSNSASSVNSANPRSTSPRRESWRSWQPSQ